MSKTPQVASLVLCFDDNGDDTVNVSLVDSSANVICSNSIAWDDIMGVLPSEATVESPLVSTKEKSISANI